MEKRILQPEQVIVPGEYELGNEQILKIYWDICNRGHAECLAPVVVARWDILGPDREDKLSSILQHYLNWQSDDNIQQSIKRFDRFKKVIRRAPYYLFDGNHRSVAQALTHNPINAIEIQSDQDIADIRKEMRKGEFPVFVRPENSLTELVESFEKYVIGDKGYFIGDDTRQAMTIHERVKRLTSNRDLPRYMIARYRQGK